MPKLTAPHLSSYPLTLGITTVILLSDSKLQQANEYQMSWWKSNWEQIVKRSLLYAACFQVQSHISKRCVSLSSFHLKHPNRVQFQFERWVKIKP